MCTVSTLARARPLLTNCRRVRLSFTSRYSYAQFPKLDPSCMRTCGALAFPPLPRLSDTRARDGCRCPLSHLPRATAQALPSPRTRACSRPATSRSLRPTQIARDLGAAVP
eukprot:6090740-Pleurochrysis_carterae.AAC.2